MPNEAAIDAGKRLRQFYIVTHTISVSAGIKQEALEDLLRGCLRKI